MRPGDHIKTDRLGYSHHGIYVGRDQVIHWRKNAESGRPMVEKTTLAEFGDGGPVRIVPDERAFSPEEVVWRAESLLGIEGYHLAFNNCEHLAAWCRRGAPASRQVRRVAAVTVKGLAIAGYKSGAKAGLKAAEKAATKSLGRLAAKAGWRGACSPWLFLADGLELGVELLGERIGAAPKTARAAAQATGCTASLAIGALTGGPLGAALGAWLWGLGRLAGGLLARGRPLAPVDR